jgi:hypothetical protein
LEDPANLKTKIKRVHKINDSDVQLPARRKLHIDRMMENAGVLQMKTAFELSSSKPKSSKLFPLAIAISWFFVPVKFPAKQRLNPLVTLYDATTITPSRLTANRGVDGSLRLKSDVQKVHSSIENNGLIIKTSQLSIRWNWPMISRLSLRQKTRTIQCTKKGLWKMRTTVVAACHMSHVYCHHA